MDPITATQNAIVAFFNFASTPVGQQILQDIYAIDKTLFSKIGDLFSHLHAQVAASPVTPLPVAKTA